MNLTYRKSYILTRVLMFRKIHMLNIKINQGRNQKCTECGKIETQQRPVKLVSESLVRRGEIIMKLVIQRVRHASVTVDSSICGSIGLGYMVLLGICDDDNEDTVRKMIKKMVNLRIFEDENGKTNLSIKDVNGEILVVSQFTLYADCKHGNRPSFTTAGSPEHAKELYEFTLKLLENEYGIKPQAGIFGADMKVELLNDGPFTIFLDSKELAF